MQPGISRATSMGVLGFLIGGLLVIVIRGLQGLDPFYTLDAAALRDVGSFIGPVMVFGTFFSAAFFIWGIGAFDPRMNIHGESPADEEEETPAATGEILSAYTWKISFWLIVGAVLIVVAAAVGPSLEAVNEADSSVLEVGMVPLESVMPFGMQPPFGLEGVMVSQLVIFAVFFIWTMLSLAVAALVIWALMAFFVAGKRSPNQVSLRVPLFILLVAALAPAPVVTPDLMPPAVFGVILVVLAVALLVPVPVLKFIIPRGIWERFAAVEWSQIVPNAARWLANALRALPKYLQ